MKTPRLTILSGTLWENCRKWNTEKYDCFGTEKPIAYILFYGKEKKKHTKKLMRLYKTIFSFHGYSSNEMSKPKQILFIIVHYLCCYENLTTKLVYKH